MGAAVDERLVYVASLDNLLRALRPGSGNRSGKPTSRLERSRRQRRSAGIVIVTGNNPTLVHLRRNHWGADCQFRVAADLQGVPLVDPSLEPFVSRWSRSLSEGARDRSATDRHDVSRASPRSVSDPAGQAAQSRASYSAQLPISNYKLPTAKSQVPNVQVTFGALEIGG